MRACLVILCTLLLCLGGDRLWAEAGGANHLWEQGTEALGHGEGARAVSILDMLSEQYPSDPLADDALFLAGSLLQEQLSQPAQALLRYQQLLQRFPDSRAALAAQRRVAQLKRGLGTQNRGEAAIIDFQTIVQGAPDRSQEQSRQMAQALIENHSEWPEIYRVRLWLAAGSRGMNAGKEARRYFGEVVQGKAPGSAKIEALLGIAEVCIAQRQHSCARRALAALDARHDLNRANKRARAQVGKLLREGERRTFLSAASYLLFVVIQLILVLFLRRECGDWRRTGRALSRPTTEVFYMLPLAILLIIMAMTGHREIGPAVAIICGGGLLTTWLLSASLRQSNTISLARAVILITLSLLSTASFVYLALGELWLSV